MAEFESDEFVELERLLNDPDVVIEPARIWALAAQVAARSLSAG